MSGDDNSFSIERFENRTSVYRGGLIPPGRRSPNQYVTLLHEADRLCYSMTGGVAKYVFLLNNVGLWKLAKSFIFIQ